VILWGTPVRAQDALGHALQDVRYFREHDRHLGPGQVVAESTHYIDPNEMKRINERTNQIIRESHNKGDKRSMD
jgi:hypothetical protein